MNHRRIPHRCHYCGCQLRAGRLVCAAHSDLPTRDPHHIAETLKPLQAPPDLPVLILARRAA